MALPQHGILHSVIKRKISDAAETLLEAHYGIVDPKGVRFQRVSDGEFLMRTGDATFSVTVRTKIG